MKLLTLISAFSFLFSALVFAAAEVPLTWDAAPGTNVVGYYLYAGTNNLAISRANALRIDVGTNCTGSVFVPAGRWYFAATTYNSQRVESDLSNVETTEVPAAPSAMRVVILQYNSSLTSTNWQDAGFFRVKIQ